MTNEAAHAESVATRLRIAVERVVELLAEAGVFVRTVAGCLPKSRVQRTERQRGAEPGPAGVSSFSQE